MKTFCCSILIGASFILIMVAPLSAQEQKKVSGIKILEKVLDEYGIEAAKSKFLEIAAQKDKGSFNEKDFLDCGSKLSGEGKLTEAAIIYSMGLKLFPRSFGLNIALGRIYRALGFSDRDVHHTNTAFGIRNEKILTDYLDNKNILKSAEDVISKYLEAIGGRRKLTKIKTIQMTLTKLNSINRSEAFKRYYKYPHFYRQDIIELGHGNVTDGKKVWRVKDGHWKETPNSNSKYVPDIYNDFIDYEKRGITFELIGLEVQDSLVFYKVIKTYKDGNRRELYFDSDSGLLSIERRDWGIGKDIKRYFDWREVEGVLFPFMFVVTNKIGLGSAHGGIIKDIKINEPIKDSLFKSSTPGHLNYCP